MVAGVSETGGVAPGDIERIGSIQGGQGLKAGSGIAGQRAGMGGLRADGGGV
jgi:hypothetical protein